MDIFTSFMSEENVQKYRVMNYRFDSSPVTLLINTTEQL